MIWHSAQVNEVLNELKTNSESGLLNGVADERLETYGKNIITRAEKPSLIKRFLDQLKSKTLIALVIISLLSFVVSLIYSQSNSYFALIIIGIVILNAFISAFHLFTCDNAFDDIKQITIPTVNVLRDGIIKNIDSSELVVGDIILLAEGDYVTADARLIETNELRCNESSLTGEDIPVEKDANALLEDIVNLPMRKNMVFSGTTVIHGNAKAVVVATALNTESGMATAIMEQTGSNTLPVQNELDLIGKIVNTVILVVCVLFFLIGMIRNFNSSAPFALTTLNMLLNSVALAVAAIPQSLPAIATIVIATGTGRILNDKIILKDSKAFETIGKTNVICSDKTGILTHKKMSLSKIYNGKKVTDLLIDSVDEQTAIVLNLAAACSTLQNDSTEDAIEEACLNYNSKSKEDINALFPKLTYIPFDSHRKCMTVITMINERPFAIVKGAPEMVIPKCNTAKSEELFNVNDELANDGLRVVCIAMRPLDSIPANPNSEDVECNLTFVGLLGLTEPIRQSAIEDIIACKKAGIKTVMVTGDNINTAKAIARKIGLILDDSEAIDGVQISEMSDNELIENVDKYSVFARITPSDKLRIVKAFKAKNMIVTVTGDSINDAETLAVADVGCAIGQYGDDVAKGNADIIILKNNFGSIVKALKESRGFYSNIRKIVYYLCSCNFAELLFMLIGILAFKVPVLIAVQFLLINLLTDCAPAISLSMEKAEDSVMNGNSFAAQSKIFNVKAFCSVIIQSIFIALITLTAYIIGNNTSALIATTMAFATLGISQILHCLNNKFENTIFNKKLFSNKFMNNAVFATLFVVMFLVFTPFGFSFGLTILTFGEFLISLLLALLIIPFSELLKFLQNK